MNRIHARIAQERTGAQEPGVGIDGDNDAHRGIVGPNAAPPLLDPARETALAERIGSFSGCGRSRSRAECGYSPVDDLKNRMRV